MLVTVTTLSLTMVNGSLLADPLFSATEKPEPNSTPLTAGMARRALANSPSTVSNTGSPKPTGTLRAMPSIIPPTLSPSALTFSITSAIASAAFRSAHLTGFWLTFLLISANPCGSAFIPPISTVCARTSISSRLSNFLAIAPAITKPAVILPENLPPPRKSLNPPYFIKAV